MYEPFSPEILQASSVKGLILRKVLLSDFNCPNPEIWPSPACRFTPCVFCYVSDRQLHVQAQSTW